MKYKRYKDPVHVTNGLTQAISACREAFTQDDWQTVIDIARKTRQESFADHPRVQCVMRYYQAYALFRQQNYVVTEELVQLVRETLHITTLTPAPGVQHVSPPYLYHIKVCFLYSILGHYAYQQQEYPLALLLLMPAYVDMMDDNFPIAGLEPKAPRTEPLFCAESLTFSRIIHLYHQFGCVSEAYEILFYAQAEQFSAPLEETIVGDIRQSAGYQAYRHQAEQYIPTTEEPALEGKGAWDPKAVAYAQTLRYKWQTPIEAFAHRSLVFAYSASQQNTPCVLVLEGDIHWPGDFILSECAQFFSPPEGAQPSIVIIEGHLVVDGNLLLTQPATPLQLVVEGNAQAHIVFQQSYLSVSGRLSAELLLLERNSMTYAPQIETQMGRRAHSSSVQGNLMQHLGRYLNNNKSNTWGQFAPLSLRGFLLSNSVLENGGTLSEEQVQEQFVRLLQLRKDTTDKRNITEHLCPHSLNGDLENADFCYQRLWHAYQQHLPFS